jgi:hypothetical protein
MRKNFGGTENTLHVALVAVFAFVIGIASQNGDWWRATKRALTPMEHEEFTNYDKDKYWASKIRAGGFIIHLRHAQRERWEDVAAFDMVEIATKADASQSSYKRAVCLTERGIEEAKIIGEVFRLAEVKIDKVISSPSCRARQTAMYAFGHVDAIANSLLHRVAIMRDQHGDFARDLRRVFDGLDPKSGSNVVTSGHSGTFRFDKGILLDKNETGGDPDRGHETGFIVLEKVNGKLIARHKFLSIRHLANAVIKLPLEYKELPN